MDIIHNSKVNNLIRWACLVSLPIMLTVGIVFYKSDPSALVIFFAFLIFYVQLPGLLILYLLKIDLRHLSSTLIVGFFAGWAFVTLEYFITDLLQTNILLYAAGPICSVLYVILLRCNIFSTLPAIWRTFTKVPVSFCIFIALAFLYSMLNTQFEYMNPALCDYTYMNADKAYHMGLINSLSHDYPLISPWVQGREIHYHIFTELLYSVPVRLFGLTADKVLLMCGPIMTTYVFGLSLYSLFREFSSRKMRAGFYCLIVLLSNIYITRNIYASLPFLFVFKNENAAGFGVSAAMVAVIVFKYWYKRYADDINRLDGCKHAIFSSNSSLNYFMILVAITMLLTGIKGPMGLVFMGGIWGTFILGMLLRSVKFRTALPLLILSLSFMFIYILILGSKGQANGSGDSVIAFATIAHIAFYRTGLVALMKSIGLPHIVRLGVIFVVFMVFLLTAFIVPFTAGYIRELYIVLTKKRAFNFTKVIIYAECFIGFVCFFCLNYSGHSQVYFGLVSVFFAPLIAFWFMEDMEISKIKVYRTVKAVMVVCLIFTAFTLGGYYIKHVDNALGYLDTSKTYNKYMSISNSEYEAMEWIRLNTPDDALLATDRYYSVPLSKYSYEDRWTNRFFLYAVYSNRFCYIAGSGYNLPAGDWIIRRDMLQTNAELYDSNNAERGQLAKKLGVDYVVVSKRFTNIPSLSGSGYNLCFENDDVIVYRVD